VQRTNSIQDPPVARLISDRSKECGDPGSGEPVARLWGWSPVLPCWSRRHRVGLRIPCEQRPGPALPDVTGTGDGSRHVRRYAPTRTGPAAWFAIRCAAGPPPLPTRDTTGRDACLRAT